MAILTGLRVLRRDMGVVIEVFDNSPFRISPPGWIFLWVFPFGQAPDWLPFSPGCEKPSHWLLQIPEHLRVWVVRLPLPIRQLHARWRLFHRDWRLAPELRYLPA